MSETGLVDFNSEIASQALAVTAQAAHDGVTVLRCRLAANPGSWLTLSQFTLCVHESHPVEMVCRSADGGKTQRHLVTAGQAHFNLANRPAHVAWSAEKHTLAVAFDDAFINQVVGEAFDGRIPEIRPQAAIRDPTVEELAACLRRDMAANSRASRLCLGYVGAMLVLRLFDAYGETAKPLQIFRGGLGGAQQRRVLDYIEAHLADDIGLADLAAAAGLGVHHFGKAFKASLGSAPCHFLIQQRVLRAQRLLESSSQSITEIAHSLGFSSHSHFTDTFRKMIGVTPSQFRKDRM